MNTTINIPIGAVIAFGAAIGAPATFITGGVKFVRRILEDQLHLDPPKWVWIALAILGGLGFAWAFDFNAMPLLGFARGHVAGEIITGLCVGGSSMVAHTKIDEWGARANAIRAAAPAPATETTSTPYPGDGAQDVDDAAA